MKAVFERGEGLGEVFGECRGDYFYFLEAEVGEDLFSAGGGGGEDYAFGAELGDGREVKRLERARKSSGRILGWRLVGGGGLVGRRGVRWS